MSDREFINVHVFDNTVIRKVGLKFNLNEKCELFNWLLNNINILNIEPHCIEGIKLIITDTEKPPNKDINSDVYADDILAEICYLIKDVNNEDKLSIIKSVLEQMGDMFQLGRCQVGRVSRLYQLLKSIKESSVDEENRKKKESEEKTN